MDTFASMRNLIVLALGAILVMLSACVIMSPVKNVGVALNGAEEVPPVATGRVPPARSWWRTTSR